MSSSDFPSRVCSGLYETVTSSEKELAPSLTGGPKISQMELTLCALVNHETKRHAEHTGNHTVVVENQTSPRWTTCESGRPRPWSLFFSECILSAEGTTLEKARAAHAVPDRVRPAYELPVKSYSSWTLLPRHGVPVRWETLVDCSHSGPGSGSGRSLAEPESLLACAAHRCLGLLRQLFILLQRNAALLLDSAPVGTRSFPAAREALRLTPELCNHILCTDVLRLLLRCPAEAASELANLVLAVRVCFVLTRVHLHAYRPSWTEQADRDLADNSAAKWTRTVFSNLLSFSSNGWPAQAEERKKEKQTNQIHNSKIMKKRGKKQK